MRHNIHGLQRLSRQLGFYIKAIDSIDFIPKKLDAIGLIFVERKDIDNPTTDRKLTRLGHKINSLKIVFEQGLIDKVST